MDFLHFLGKLIVILELGEVAVVVVGIVGGIGVGNDIAVLVDDIALHIELLTCFQTFYLYAVVKLVVELLLPLSFLLCLDILLYLLLIELHSEQIRHIIA